MKPQPFFLLLLLSVPSIIGCSPDQEVTQKAGPNIIYILADDLGYGDISAFNEDSKLISPHIDALAQAGMMFTDAHTNSAVCTPTRYGILTGRYAWRTRMKKSVLWSWSEPLINQGRTTVASFLKKHDYHTACIGKWHLGLGWEKDSIGVVDITKPVSGGPIALGFDYFYGITASLDIPPYIYIENDRSTSHKIDTIEAMAGKAFWRSGQIGDDFEMEDVLPNLTQKAVSYINEQAQTDQPFFLYFPLPAPHTPILPTEAFKGKSKTNEYGDFVLMVDDVVGQIVKAVEANGISEHTLIIFTSDNGCSPMADFAELASFGHDPSGPFRGHKADIFEGGHRVPFVVKWPARVAAGTQSDEIICVTDLLATCAAIVGDSLADHEGEDSYNLLPLLEGQKLDQPLREATIHHSIDGAYAIRQGDWKLAFCPGSGGWSEPSYQKAMELRLAPMQLFKLSEDIGEENNVAAQNSQVVAHLSKLMNSYIQNGRSTPGEPQQNDTETFLYLRR